MSAVACGLLHELPPVKNEKDKGTLRGVRCMVRFPCSCCCLSFFVAILLSFAGFQIISANSGSFGPFKLGVDYPNFDLIAMNSDALVLAREESSLALLGALPSAGRRGWGRRLGTSQLDEDMRIARKNPTHLPSSSTELLASFAAEWRAGGTGGASHGRSLSKIAQEQQSMMMATALLAVGARDGVTNLYDDAGLEQLCTFRAGLMTNEPTWKDYCYMVDDPMHRGHPDNATHVCHNGTDALSMFYGDDDYDIADIDTAVFATKNFDDIVAAISTRPPDFAALADYPSEDVAAVQTLYFKLFGYLIGPWQSQQAVCKPSMKKDVSKVMKVLAHVREAPSLESFNGILNQYFDKNFNVANPVTRYTKGFYMYGAPLAGWDNYIEEVAKTEQDTKYARWWATSKFRDLYSGRKSKDLWPTGEPALLNTQLLLSEILLVLIGDGLKAIAPVMLVTLVVWIQTGSLLIAIVTITEIILSLTTALFVTSGLLQIKWVSLQSFLALYIVLAIGADDVFVFLDAYKQSFYKGPEVNQSLDHRMSWVYRRAGLAMLITSLTTCAAFVASAVTSPIPELQNFGIFAACIIMIDYLLVMTFLCANTILFHNWLEMKPGLCCACFDGCFPNWRCAKGGCMRMCTFGEPECKALRTTPIAAEGKAIEAKKKPFSVTIFEDIFPFNMIIKSLPRRLISMFLCLAFFVAMLVSMTGIEPQTTTENFLPDSHPFQKNIAINNEFEASNMDRTVEINFVYGFKENDPLDQTGVNLIFDADFKGKPNYDASFELTPAAQLAVLEVCDIMTNAPATKVEIDTETGNTTVLTACFMQTFKAYREFKGAEFPVPTAAEAATALEAWLEDTDELLPKALRASTEDFVEDVGWTKDAATEKLTLAWIKLRANSKLGARAFLPSSKLREFYDEWEAVLAASNAKASATPLGVGFQVSGVSSGRSNKWIFMTVQEAYVRMALVGASVGLAIAAVVLLISTRNLIVTAACMGTIAAALVCVVGTIVAMGWQLGSNESLSIMVLCGFAVDYVVHLSHAYMESTSPTRLERVHDALRDLGISVFWGMLTSMFSAGALASCEIQFLSKFGVFFALTIMYAYLWSVLFLMPLLACIGPEPKKGGASDDPKGLQIAASSSPTLDAVPPSPNTQAVIDGGNSLPPSPPASEHGGDEPKWAVKRAQVVPQIV